MAAPALHRSGSVEPNAPALQRGASLEVAATVMAPATQSSTTAAIEPTVTCQVCFEDGLTENNTFSKLCGDSCPAVVCGECLRHHLTGIVDAGFDGSCPRLKCITCPSRVVKYSIFKDSVASETINLHTQRATKLLSIQCGRCHQRKNVFEPFDASGEARKWVGANWQAENPVQSGKVVRAKWITKSGKVSVHNAKIRSVNADGTVFVDWLTEDNQPTKFISAHYDASRILPCMSELADVRELAAYEANEISEAQFYSLAQEAAADPFAAGDNQGPCTFIKSLLHAIEDPERRANLHVRYLRDFPQVITKCCSGEQCFMCKINGFHSGMTCAQYQASKTTSEDMLTCENCGIYLVKGDGCNSVSCVCGHYFSWSTRLMAMKAEVARAFLRTIVDQRRAAREEALEDSKHERVGGQEETKSAESAGEQIPDHEVAEIALEFVFPETVGIAELTPPAEHVTQARVFLEVNTEQADRARAEVWGRAFRGYKGLAEAVALDNATETLHARTTAYVTRHFPERFTSAIRQFNGSFRTHQRSRIQTASAQRLAARNRAERFIGARRPLTSTALSNAWIGTYGRGDRALAARQAVNFLTSGRCGSLSQQHRDSLEAFCDIFSSLVKFVRDERKMARFFELRRDDPELCAIAVDIAICGLNNEIACEALEGYSAAVAAAKAAAGEGYVMLFEEALACACAAIAVGGVESVENQWAAEATTLASEAWLRAFGGDFDRAVEEAARESAEQSRSISPRGFEPKSLGLSSLFGDEEGQDEDEHDYCTWVHGIDYRPVFDGALRSFKALNREAIDKIVNERIAAWPDDMGLVLPVGAIES